MNANVITNYSKLKLSLFFLPVLFLFAIFLFLYYHNSINVDNYILIQQNCFFFINSKLSLFPNVLYNVTQIGDELILMSFLSIFIVYAPKIWESLISASIVSALFSWLLKRFFEVPRPAAVFDHNSFVIIGKTLSGNTSLPSGHSITVFTILTVLLYAFMPAKLKHKISWHIFIISLGLMLVITRVGVGAHYPLDVIIGSIIGYISGLAGIFISRKYKVWSWINNKKFYPFFILLFLICSIVLVNKISIEQLTIYYLSLASLCFSLYKITIIYVKK